MTSHLRLLGWGVRPSLRRLEALGAALLVSLSSVVCLGLGSEPPVVELTSMRLIDDGIEVVARGLLVDLRRYDSGFEVLVISSPDGQDTLRILVSEGLGPPPSTYARFGDSLRVLGRVSNSGSEVALHCESGSVSVESRAEAALTVSILSRTWHLLLGDELRIRGVVVSPIASEGLRLFDADFENSIMLRGVAPPIGNGIAFEAILIGVLGLDGSTMSLFIEVTDLVLR